MMNVSHNALSGEAYLARQWEKGLKRDLTIQNEKSAKGGCDI